MFLKGLVIFIKLFSLLLNTSLSLFKDFKVTSASPNFPKQSSVNSFTFYYSTKMSLQITF